MSGFGRKVAGALLALAAAVGASGCGSETATRTPGDYPVKPETPASSPGIRYGELPTPTPTPTPTVCPASGVVVLGGLVDAAMGVRATTIALKNCGQRTYRVNGYPQIVALDKDRDPLKLKIKHGNSHTGTVQDKGPTPITLAPGESAESVLYWTNRVTSFDPPPVGAYLVIAPADGAEAQTLPFHLDMGTSAELDVTAWALPRP
ncbi:DUF4232 domain-containing protein [Streptomyces sp. NPDC020681]|uniref:DUF4232 domain-containing protein n=1 Tax=Streptomyces sp. NPDC020681 TaxID=3365083 RepID=UPI0037BA13FB